MGMKRILIMAVSAFMLFSCEKENAGGSGPAPKDGVVAITFNSGKPGTKADATPEEADGSMFSDLWLWLVRKDGTAEDVRRFVHFTFDATTERAVEFDAVERGDYVLYAVANFTNDRGVFTAYTPAGYNVNDNTYAESDIPATAKKQLDDTFKKLTLAPLENNVPPTVQKNGGKLPISIVKEFSVGAGINRVDAELTRVCGRISIVVRNLSPDYDIAINDFSLSKHNPKTGYLFADNHNVPGGDDFYQEFASFSKKDGENYALIKAGTDATILSQLLYETGEGISLGLKIGGAMLVDSEMNKIEEENLYSSTTIDHWYYHILDAAAPSSGSQYLVVPTSNISAGLCDGGNLSLNALKYYDKDRKLLNPDNINNWLWTYSTSNPTLKNVSSNRNLSIGNNRPSLVTNTNNTSLNIRETDTGYNIYRNTNYLSANDASVILSSNNNSSNCIWQFLPVERVNIPETVVTTNGKAINYSTDAVQIIGATGAAVPLTHICRNQDLTITVNISFNPYIGEFEYVILPWNGRDIPEIEFN